MQRNKIIMLLILLAVFAFLHETEERITKNIGQLHTLLAPDTTQQPGIDIPRFTSLLDHE